MGIEQNLSMKRFLFAFSKINSRRMHSKIDAIRNVGIVAHIDAGKTTTTGLRIQKLSYRLHPLKYVSPFVPREYAIHNWCH